MRGLAGWSLLAMILLFGAVEHVSGEDAELNCEELGFTGLVLCSDCDVFARVVKNEGKKKELIKDCKKCCAQESEDNLSQMTFASAVLELCGRKLPFYSEISRFVDESARNFPLLKIRWRQGSSPKLVLRDEKGVEKETVRIDSWKTEHIEEFLAAKLKSPTVDKKAPLDKKATS